MLRGGVAGDFYRLGIPCGALNDIAAVMGDPQVRDRNMLTELALTNGEPLLTAACPLEFVGTAEVPATPAPMLDERRAALLEELRLGMVQFRG